MSLIMSCALFFQVFEDETADCVCQVKDCTIVKHHGCYGLVMEKNVGSRQSFLC